MKAIINFKGILIINSSLKIIFAGTPDFAATALEALLVQQFSVARVDPADRPAGRGMRLTASPVKQLALARSLPLLQPASLKSVDVQQELANYAADVNGGCGLWANIAHQRYCSCHATAA